MNQCMYDRVVTRINVRNEGTQQAGWSVLFMTKSCEPINKKIKK